jgi:cell division protein YceG involved in septum cleavage
MRERLQRYTERFLYRVQTYWAIARVYPRRSIAIITSTVIIFLLLITFAVSASAPEEFPTNVLVTLPAKASAVTLTDALVQDHLIRSSFLFYAVTRLSKLDTSLEGGAYIFDKPLNVFDIARRLGNGEHGITASRITLTEGMTTLVLDLI